VPAVNCLCGGKGYIVKDGEKVACDCSKVRRLAVYFPDAASAMDNPTEVMDEVLAMQFEDNVFCRLPRTATEGRTNLVKMSYLMVHDCPTYKILNVYELIEVYLSRHPVYSSLFQMTFPATILMEGYNEFPNVRQNDAILQFLDIAKRGGGKVLYLSRKSVTEQALVEYFKQNSWQLLEMTKNVEGGKRVV